MNKIFLILSNYSKLHLDAGKILNTNSSQMAKHGLQWQATLNTLWQDLTLDTLTVQYTNLWKCRHGGLDASLEQKVGEGIIAKLAELSAKIDANSNLVWFTGPLNTEAIQAVVTAFAGNATLAQRQVHPVLLLEEQSHALMDRIKMLWKEEEYPWITQEMRSQGAFANYFTVYNKVTEFFGAENTHVLIPGQQNGLQNVLTGLESILGLPLGFLAGESYPLPNSYAALDITNAVFKFPFTKDGKIYLDRQEFYKKLIQVENEQQFEQVNGLSQQAIDYGAWFVEQNARLAERLGMPKLFTETEENIVSVPGPDLTLKQADAFVAALHNKERQAFLRYFRDREDPFSPEELTFATALENYRKKIDPVSGFTFPRPKPVLSVLTMTRNHKKYIMECMESVSAQKTDFPIEHIIVDDASDDGNQDIIDNYASTHPHVRPIYLTSRSTGGHNIRTLFEACGSEFAALCDGDDYFSNNAKLQKQVDFLKANKDCAVCFHPVLVVYENNTHPSFIYPLPESLPRGQKEKYYLSDLVKHNFIQTNSVVYRWRFKAGLPDWFRSDLCPSDWYWHILHAEIGKIGYIPELMSIYRRHSASYYATSFTSSSVEHRRIHGMNELKTYNAINEHFNNRYLRPLSMLANGVLSDFLRVMVKTGNSDLMDEAVEKYPEFGKLFLRELRIVNKK